MALKKTDYSKKNRKAAGRKARRAEDKRAARA